MSGFKFVEGAADEKGLEIGAFMIKYADSIGQIGAFMVKNEALIKTMAQQQAELQTEVGPTPQIQVTYFENWIQNLERILFHVKPTTRCQIVDVVNASSKKSIKMAAAGQYFTWARMFPPNGALLFNVVDLPLPDSVNPRIQFNRANMTVTIAPGVSPNELGILFAKEDLMIETDVYIPLASYGGIISGGGHGLGNDQGGVSDYVSQVKIVNAKGIIDTYPRSPPAGFTKDEVTRAAQLNLGLFGIAVEFTLRVKTVRYVQVDTTNLQIKDLFTTSSQVKAFTDAFWSLEIIWFPFNSLAGNADLLPSWDPDNDFTQIQGKNFVEPDTTPPAGSTVQKLPETLYDEASADNLVYTMEFCWAYDPNDPIVVVNCVRDMLDVIKDYRTQYFPTGLFVDMRFMGQSDTLISPGVVGQTTGRSFYIQIVGFTFALNYEDFYRDLADKWFQRGGLPHWHKYWTILRDVEKHIHDNANGRIKKFDDIRKALDVDPNNLFVNDPMTKLLEYTP